MSSRSRKVKRPEGHILEGACLSTVTSEITDGRRALMMISLCLSLCIFCCVFFPSVCSDSFTFLPRLSFCASLSLGRGQSHCQARLPGFLGTSLHTIMSVTEEQRGRGRGGPPRTTDRGVLHVKTETREPKDRVRRQSRV